MTAYKAAVNESAAIASANRESDFRALQRLDEKARAAYQRWVHAQDRESMDVWRNAQRVFGVNFSEYMRRYG